MATPGFNIAFGLAEMNSDEATELSEIKNYGFIDVLYAGKKLATRPCTSEDKL